MTDKPDKNDKKPKLGQRLQCAAELVRSGAFVADVGTDHAYLPIALMLDGEICGGVVTDIHTGPIERARENICRYGLLDQLTPICCDGLAAEECRRAEDIFILGMGGELIAGILSRAPWTKKEGIRLILQPMTHAELLRKFLLEQGYSILCERLVSEDRIYQVIHAEYSGETCDYTPLELLLGKENLSRREDPFTRELVCRWERIFCERREGTRSGGADTDEEDRYLQEIGEWKYDGS